MADRGWYDDGDYHDSVQRAGRAARFGWAAIAGTAGVLGLVLIALAVICVVGVLACLYVVMAMDHQARPGRLRARCAGASGQSQ
jgi:hypothetical protein